MLGSFVDWITYNLLGFSRESSFANIINFFIYDSLKILMLLFVMISIIGFLRTYISQNAVKKWLSHKKGLGNFYAASFGALTPFCSCSSIPIFISFLKAGVPLGVTFSFLITSPIINEYLVVLMLGFFGWRITLMYILSGMMICIFSGIILGKLSLDKYIVEDMVNKQGKTEEKNNYKNVRERLIYGINEAISIIKKIWIWVLVGVGIGALIHNYVPREFIRSVISKTGIFSVPIATILGVPMYGSCAAIIPIAIVLFKKGVPLGTALSFMMATAALSLPEAVILRRAMKFQLILIFFGITTLAIMFPGFLFNFLSLINI